MVDMELVDNKKWYKAFMNTGDDDIIWYTNDGAQQRISNWRYAIRYIGHIRQQLKVYDWDGRVATICGFFAIEKRPRWTYIEDDDGYFAF